MQASAILPTAPGILPTPPGDSASSSEDAALQEAGDFTPGSVLGGSYRLIRRLGRGGMGDIHLASHERLPGQFVVKVLSPDLVSDQDAFVRFRQEAVVMANIRHPNVVQLVDFNFTMAGLPFLVMEYLPGKDLADILSTRPFLAASQVSSIVRQVACALDTAHKLGIVHRDLKPENIMVVPCEGQGDLIKVIDFGISKARRFNHVTSASMVMGTPEFMSPEQAQGRQEEVDSRSDQFALAVISYLLLTGRTPWGVIAPVEILHRVVNNPPLPLTHDDTWRAVEAVLFRAMAKGPQDRYPSTLAFWRALDRAMVTDGLIPNASGYGSTIHGAGPGIYVESRGTPPIVQPATPVDAVILESGIDASVGASGSTPATEQLDASSSVLEQDSQGAEVPQFSLGASERFVESERCPTTAMRRANPKVSREQPRRRGRLGWQAVVLLVVLASGAYIGLQDGATVRARAGGGLNALRTLAARAAERGMNEGQRLFRAAKGGRGPAGQGRIGKAFALDAP
ncbi:MAG: serine/threonine-protein kinase [Polyangia bacterium]